jgi:hypothetical protein
MNFNVEVSVFRHWDLTKIIDYIVESGLTLIHFELKGDWITLQVAGSNYLDSGLFEEFIEDIEYLFDKEQGLV